MKHQTTISNTLNIGVDLILFDGEEFGRPHLGNYCVGSRHLAQNIQELYPERLPLKAVIFAYFVNLILSGLVVPWRPCGA